MTATPSFIVSDDSDFAVQPSAGWIRLSSIIITDDGDVAARVFNPTLFLTRELGMTEWWHAAAFAAIIGTDFTAHVVGRFHDHHRRQLARRGVTAGAGARDVDADTDADTLSAYNIAVAVVRELALSSGSTEEFLTRLSRTLDDSGMPDRDEFMAAVEVSMKEFDYVHAVERQNAVKSRVTDDPTSVRIPRYRTRPFSKPDVRRSTDAYGVLLQHSRRAKLASNVASMMAWLRDDVRASFGDVEPPQDWLRRNVTRDDSPSPALWRVTLQHAVKRPHSQWAGVIVDTVFGLGVVLSVVDEPSLPLRVNVLLWCRVTRTLEANEVLHVVHCLCWCV
jgi:hypothetical protein